MKANAKLFPAVIYLQCDEDDFGPCEYPKCGCEVSWCAEMINSGDVEYKKTANRIIGEHWLETALGMINAGDAEEEVMNGYGWYKKC